MASKIVASVECYHCGEDCGNSPVKAHEKDFCCEGCKMVFEILNKNGLCDYYTISQKPGINQRKIIRENKFAFLEEEKIKQSLVNFSDNNQTHVGFYLPQIHCSSCLWLLENLHRINSHIISSKVNFTKKEVDIVFNHNEISLRRVAELLTGIGYEPYISLQNLAPRKTFVNRSKMYKLGIAAFCFSNIMLLSFPDYLGMDSKEQDLGIVFRYLSFLLALPVFFYSASEFYTSAWKSLKHGFLNIDAPIVLAVAVTFGRSVFEVFTQSGGGYFDSMSGIVFFMLLGRVLQDKTYEQLSFERDYTSYFPIAVTRIKNERQEEVASLPEIRLDDTLLIHSQELIPADGILTRGKALIDYSFVTGESIPVAKEMGEIVYAGGKQIGSNIELLVIKEVAQSYLTKLWNNKEMQHDAKDEEKSFVHLLSRYFTWIVFGIAAIAAFYWYFIDTTLIWNAVTAVLIIACPCALLLSNTFTNGNILRLLGRNRFYLRNAQTIEDIAQIDCIVFDKTGTLTTGEYQKLSYEGLPLQDDLKHKIAVLASQSTHPMSKALSAWAGKANMEMVIGYEEHPGKGVEGMVDGCLIKMGSKEYLTGSTEKETGTAVYLAADNKLMGKFFFKNHYRDQVPAMVKQLKNKYALSVLSGDNAGEKNYLQKLFGSDSNILFNQKPEDKLQVIKTLQSAGHKVMMIGDGLNDAGALQQANVGIAITENSNNFTPASDAILEAAQLPRLHQFIQLCKGNKTIVMIAFIISILYNIIGIFFAVQGVLSPLIAAILMPSSSLSILIISFGISNIMARNMKLK